MAAPSLSKADWMESSLLTRDVVYEISRSWASSGTPGTNSVVAENSVEWSEGLTLSAEDLLMLRAEKAAYTVLAALPSGCRGEPGAAELERLMARERILETELALVSAALAEAGVDHLLLRGPALGRSYPPGWKRQYNDLDVLVRYEEQLTTALDALAAHGYYLARPIVCRAQRGRSWLGVALNKTVPRLGHPAYLDLATLGPGLGAGGAFVLPDAAWEGLERLEGTRAGVSSGIPVLTADWQAAVFAVELVERQGRFVARDLLDLCALDRVGARWPEVALLLSDAPEALAALCRAADSFGLPYDLRPRAAPGPVRGAGERGPGWRERVPAVVAGAQRAGRKVSPRATRTLIRRFPTRLWYRLGLPVYLLPTTPGFPGYAWPGTVGPQTAGLRGFVAQVQPLVPPGYTAAVFKPDAGAAA